MWRLQNLSDGPKWAWGTAIFISKFNSYKINRQQEKFDKNLSAGCIYFSGIILTSDSEFSAICPFLKFSDDSNQKAFSLNSSTKQLLCPQFFKPLHFS